MLGGRWLLATATDDIQTKVINRAAAAELSLAATQAQSIFADNQGKACPSHVLLSGATERFAVSMLMNTVNCCCGLWQNTSRALALFTQAHGDSVVCSAYLRAGLENYLCLNYPNEP